MRFDIHRLDHLEDWDEKLARRWADELQQLFLDSPEGQALLKHDESPGFWVHCLLDYCLNYLGAKLPALTLLSMEEIMQDLFPRKTSVLKREEAEEGVPELVAFWRYLGREHKLPQADAMIRYLERIAPEFPDWMFDPERYGMAKSFVMAGREAGFDMTDPESANAFIALYNARRIAAMEGLEAPHPSGLSSTLSRAEQARRKRHRKAARSARRRQRK